MLTKSRFIDAILTELKEENLALFAGAGLSVPAGFVNWKELLKPLAQDIELDIDKEDDLVSLAQYHVNHHSNRADLNQAILDNFSKKARPTDNHPIIARLPIKIFWTTNYDTLIEDSLRNIGKIADVKHSVKQIPLTVKGRDAVIYKMHGDVNHPADAILCKDDYERYHRNQSPFITALSGDLVSKTFLFLGFSFSDPNLSYILSRLRLDYEDNQRKHFCVLKKESSLPSDLPGDLEYRLIKQNHFINDLQVRYNIRTLLVDQYSEITDILMSIESQYKNKTVFISGSAHEYKTFNSESDALKFVQSISRHLIKSNHRIVSGLGLGIGSSVIDAVLQEVYHNQKHALKDELVIRPFPQSVEAKKLWTQYRSDMIDYAGIAIFMFGNKLENDKLVDSNGMEEEFDISVSKGLKVLPLGFTGYMAKKLWDRVNQNLDNYYPRATKEFVISFQALGNHKISTESALTHFKTALLEIGKSE